ncbi:MAG: YggT family protein [Spirochaetaceae bacterium]|jgi:YggT family protein|nr:YggT family protein [Spirochaetaceae bacterium]
MSIFEVVLRVLSVLVSLYSTLIFIRIILTWFPGVRFGLPYQILASITDPFLYLFSGVRFFRVGNMDFSPIAAFVLLSIVGNIVLVLSKMGYISLAIIAYLGISAISAAFSFLFGLFAVVTGLRLVAYIINADTYYSPFWRAIDAVSAPVIYRITRIFFPRRVVRYKTSLILSLTTLIVSVGGLTALTLFASRLLR